MDATVGPFTARLPGRRDLFRSFVVAYGAVVGFTAPGPRSGKDALRASPSKRNTGNVRPQDQERVSQIIKFEAAATELPFGEGLRERFIVDGYLTVSSEGLGGHVKVTFADMTAALILGAENEFVSSYGEVTVRLPMAGDKVHVSGSAVKITSIVEQLIAENNFSGIAALGDQSRAVIALDALANTDVFLSSMKAAHHLDGRRLIDILCRLSPAPSVATGWWRGTTRARTNAG